jgi:HSP20 family protein
MANLAFRDSLFQNLFDFRRDFDQIFSRFLTGFPGTQERNAESRTGTLMFVPPVDAFIEKDGKKFIVRVALPGVDPKDVNIQVQGNVLTIRGERQETHENKNADVVYREMTYGSFERDISLPDGVDTDRINAEFRNGIIEITAPVAASAMPRKVEIKSAPTARQVAAGSGS